MISKFGIKNFKGFNELAEIDLTRINLFFGVNSAGKSSIIDSFRMVQHSGPFSLLSYSETLDFDLGDPVDIINEGDLVSYKSECISDNFEKNIGLKKDFQLLKSSKGQSEDIFVIKKMNLDYNNIPYVRFNFENNINSSKEKIRGLSSDVIQSKATISFISTDIIFWKEFIKNLLDEKNYKLIRNLLTNSISIINSGSEATGAFKKIDIERLENFRKNLTKWKNVIENIATIALSSKTNIDLMKIKKAELSKDDFKKIAKASSEMQNINDIVLDPDDFTLTEAIINYFEKDIIKNFNAECSDINIPNLFNEANNDQINSWHNTIFEAVNEIIRTNDTFDFLELTNECLGKTDLYFKQIEFIPVLKQYQRTYENRGRVSRSKIFNSTKRIIEDLSNESELLKKINDWFKNSSVKSTFEVIETGDYKKLIVNDHTKKNSKPINIVDAGSGLRQLLPIIMTMFTQDYERSDSIDRYPINITLEEPEANLHPKLQIDLANLIGIMAGSLSVDNFIIETHSEHMMLAFQKLIREKKLQSQDINIYCVVKDEDGHYVHKMEIDNNGDFKTEWPQGFFDERLELIK